jgi:hypothetical protein
MLATFRLLATSPLSTNVWLSTSGTGITLSTNVLLLALREKIN